MQLFDPQVELPPNNTYVLAHFPTQPWGSSDAPNDEHKWVVVKFIQGITLLERQAMKLGLLPNPAYNSGFRADYYCSEDEHANNKLPYYWDSFGANSFNGQEASKWCHLPTEEPTNTKY